MKKQYLFGLIAVYLISFPSLSVAGLSDDFNYFVYEFQVRHQSDVGSRNRLESKTWQLAFRLNPSVTPDTITGEGSFDHVLASIKNITLSFESADNMCENLDSPYTVVGPKTYTYNQVVSMSRLSHQTGICPEYDDYMGRWNNPPLPGNDSELCFKVYYFYINIPKQDYSIHNADCGRWVIALNFNDNSSVEFHDDWTRYYFEEDKFVPYGELIYTDDSITSSDGNSVGYNMKMRSVKIYSLPDRDNPGETNNVITWKPINPAFQGNIAAYWPGIHARLGVIWIDNAIENLTESNIEHGLWASFWVKLPAHLNHYLLPWDYINYIKENTSIRGFKLVYQVRTNDGNRLRESFRNHKVYRIKKYIPCRQSHIFR